MDFLKNVLDYWRIIYWIFGVFLSGFYGKYAVHFFISEDHYKTLSRKRKLREFIFNFLGCFVGFLVGYYLLIKFQYAISQKNFNLTNFVDVLLILISFTGVSGYLPWMTYTLASRPPEVMKKYFH